MDLDLSPEQELIRDTVRDFARERVAPDAEELDREGRFPYELVGELAELGLLGIPIPEQYGGAGGDTLSYAIATVIATDESTRVSSSIAIAYESVSPPAPPYSSGMGIPSRPSSASSPTSS